MDHIDSDPTRDVDEAWDDLESDANVHVAASGGESVDLGALDDGWDLEGEPLDDAAVRPQEARGRGVSRVPDHGGALRALTKKERRELERRKRAEAAQRAVLRKREQKQLRKERARQRSEQRQIDQPAKKPVEPRRAEQPGKKPAETRGPKREPAAPKTPPARPTPRTNAPALPRKRPLQVTRALVGLIATVLLLVVVFSLFQR